MSDALDPALRPALRDLLAGRRADAPAATVRDAAALVAQGMAPLVYDAIASTGSQWPHEAVEVLRNEARRAAALEPHIEHELTIACDALGSDAILLKGSALAYTIYPRPELRPRGDTDVLIAAARRDEASAALTALGYEPQTTSGDELGLRQQIFTKRTLALDLHWELANTPLIADMHYDELAARAIAIPQLHARGLAPVHALLHACIHRVAHHHDDERLIWLYDIHLLANAVDFDEFTELARTKRVTAICARSLALANEWFGGTRTLEVVEGEPSAMLLARDRKRATQLLADLGALPGWRARAQRMWQLAFPPRAFVEETFGVRTRVLLPFVYAYRAMRGVARLFRRDRG